MNQSPIYPGFHMDQMPSLGGDPAATATLGYHHHQGWPGKLDQAATMHSMMSFCRVDFPPFKMQTALPNQMYGHPSYEGILELRKEKSRDAARSRRGKENYEYYELAKMLPLPPAITSQLDKASIIRLTIAFLKLRDFSCHGDPPWQRDMQAAAPSKPAPKGTHTRRGPVDVFESHQGTHILQSLDGFTFALSNDGRFLYISETVSIYLGLSQVEMTGSSIFDYVHVSDYQELAEQLALNSPFSSSSSSSTPSSSHSTNSPTTAPNDPDDTSSNTSRAVTPTMPERTSIMTPSMSKGFERCFCIRMKSTLTKRGVHTKCSGYRVVQILAHMRPQLSFSLARKHPPPIMGLVGMAIALPPPTITELVIDNDMFVMRLSSEFHVTYVEPRLGDMMDLSADDLTGESLYNRCHAEDLQKLKKAHLDLLNKGQVLTDYYRLMNKHGGFVWIQTCATIIYNSKNQEEQNIIAINYVLSGVEYPGCVMDMNQLATLPNHQHDNSDQSESEHGPSADTTQSHEDPRSSPPQDFGPPSSYSRKYSARSQKRPYSSCQDDCTHSVSQLLDFDAISPTRNGFGMLYSGNQEDVDTNMNNLYNGEETGTQHHTTEDKHHLNKHDCKNSRRKMDKPRKRKKEQELGSAVVESNTGIIGNSASKTSKVGSLGVEEPTRDLVSLASDLSAFNTSVTDLAADHHHQHNHHPHSDSMHPSPPPSLQTTAVNPPHMDTTTTTPLSRHTPVPEDLSVNNLPTTTTTSTNNSPPLLSPTTGVHGVSDNTTGTNGLGNNDKSWPPPVATVSSSSTSPPVSHNYPEVSAAAVTTSSSVRDLEEVMNKHLPMTPGEAELMRTEYAQSLLGLQKHKSTIQWVGSSATAAGVPNNGELTASNLLRSLYANRETVIRSNVYNPRPQYYSDVQSSLLTPPGATTDPYKDSFSSITPSSTSSSSTSHHKASPSSYSNLHHYMPHHNPMITSSTPSTAGMVTDGYSMTPPSSVSPQEKYPNYGDQLHYGENGGVMPIKPQPYSLPVGGTHLPAAAYDKASQYSAAAAAAYYGQASYAGHYREHTKNSAMW